MNRALIKGLRDGKIHSVAMDVMEVEPLPADSALRNHERNIFGSHNSSNSIDAVRLTTKEAINKLFGMLEI